ncbi:hypothetical protein [Schumannella soli]|uniref:Bacterial Ig-like domain-containing protein n=1 Tax=Schumannella soli TaxID=2590779 RepID=A0A506XSN1_9MICO|nr:hypothetical protein [Schumannella soli]TPW75764.1 hypothetical protein FJ657_07805 [Schumannella soli]
MNRLGTPADASRRFDAGRRSDSRRRLVAGIVAVGVLLVGLAVTVSPSLGAHAEIDGASSDSSSGTPASGEGPTAESDAAAPGALTPQADSTPSPSPSSSPAKDSAFRVTSHRDDDFVSGNRLTLSGQGTAGSTVRITGPGTSGGATAIDGSGAWSASLDLPNGRIQLSLVESPGGGDASAPPGSAFPSPSPGDTTISLTLRALGAPVISGGSVVYSTGIVTGTGYPRAGVSVTVTPEGRGAPVAANCPAVAVDGSWSCPISSGPGRYTITAQQFSPDDRTEISPPSATRTLVIDQDAPAPPVIDSPKDGASVSGATVFTGRGEDDASVDVFAEGNLLCSAAVSAGAWSCTADISGGGRHVVQAVQKDRAGNYSPPSAVIKLVFGSASASPSPSAPPSTPAAPGSPSSPGSPTPPGSAPPSSPGGPGDGSGGGGAGVQGDGGLGGGWADPTRFGSALPTLASTFASASWLPALLLAAAFVLLVALPLRLLVTTAGPRLRVRLPQLFGRNHRGAERTAFAAPASATGSDGDATDAGDAASRRKRWMLVAGLVVAVSLITALAIGVQDQQRYARLLLSIAIGVTVVNGVGVVVASALVAKAAGVRRVLRLVPVFLVVGVLGAVVSRLLGLEPPLVVGVVLAVAAVGAVGDRAGALIHLAQVGSLAALAVVAWIVHDLTGGATGMLGSGLAEVLTAITVSGLCSAVLLLVPVGSLPGRVIFDWSPAAWVGAALVAVVLAALALASGAGFPVMGVLLAAFAVAAACLGGWAWIRWVEPALLAR